MPQCGCGVWFRGPETAGAHEQDYIYCVQCRTPTYMDKEYVGGNCSFDLFGMSSGGESNKEGVGDDD